MLQTGLYLIITYGKMLSFIFFNILLSCILLITSHVRVYSILYMIYIYVMSALLIMYYGLVLVGLFYFLVYIGAIMILFLFSVMILDLKNVTSERNFLDFLSFGLLLALFLVLFYTNNFFSLYNTEFEFLGSLEQTIKILGYLLFEYYNIAFLFIGFILLIAMIGAIYLTNTKYGFFIRQHQNILYRSSYLLNSNVY